MRLLLFRGILRGATSGVSWTGSTNVVRPDAPRQPGRLDVKAPMAGSVLLCSGGPLGDLPPLRAICFTRSPKLVGLCCDGCDAAGSTDMPSPRAYSAGFTCEGRPLSLVVRSPVMESHRTSLPEGLSWGWCRASRLFFSRSAASDCFRRARRIMGMLLRAPCSGGGVWPVGREDARFS